MPIVSFPPSGDFLGKPIADPYLEERDKAEQQSREVVEEAQTQEPFDSDFGTVGDGDSTALLYGCQHQCSQLTPRPAPGRG